MQVFCDRLARAMVEVQTIQNFFQLGLLDADNV